MKVDGIEVYIESSATKANAELDRLIAKLTQVNTALRSTTGNATGTKGINAVSNGMKNYNKAATTTNAKTKSLTMSFSKLYATVFLVSRAFRAFGKSIGSSMDYIETYNYFNVITDKIGSEFGSAWKENGYNSAEEYANSFKTRLNELTGKMTGFSIGEEGGLYATQNVGLGLDPKEIMNFQASIASITNAVGLTGEVSTNTSKALSMLSADLSSLKNVDLETVMTNLQSGLIGQSRALYKYGYDITNTTLQEYALAEGISKKVSEMTQAEKMQLRMIAILDQSKVAYGDMANTINGVANQYRVFKQQISNLARTIGNLFIPVLQVALPYINGFVIALQRLFTWIGNLMGVDWSNLMDGISSGYTDTGLEDLADSADDATSSLEDASSAASKLKSATLGIDELNVNNPSDSSGSGSDSTSSSGGVDLSGAIGTALANYESVWNKAFDNMDNKASNIADNISASFKKMYDATEPFRESLRKLWTQGFSKLANFSFKALNDFYDDFLKPVGKWALGTGLPNLVDHLNVLLIKFNWKKLQNNLDDLWKGLEPFAKSLGNGLIDFLKNLMSVSLNTISGIGSVLGGIGKGLGWISDYSPAFIEGIGYAIGMLVTSLIGFKAVVALETAIKTFGSTLFTSILAHPYLAVATAIATFAIALYGINKASKDNKEVETYGDTLDNLTASMQANSDKIKENIQSSKDYVNGAGLAETAMAEDLAKKYFDLSEKASLTNDEKELMKDYASDLVGLIPELSDKIDAETGFLNAQREEVKLLIDTTKEYYRVQASKSKMLDAYKQQLDAEEDLAIAIKAKSDAQEKYDIQKKKTDLARETRDRSDFLESYEYARAYKKENDALKELEKGLNAFSDELVSAQEASNEASEHIIWLGEVSETATERLNSISLVNLTVESANAIDSMHGIWMNGTQILGQDAINIYDEIMAGLTPLEDGSYELGNGSIVAFGTALTDGAVDVAKTVDDTYIATMEQALGDGYDVAYDGAGNLVLAYTEGLESQKVVAVNAWGDFGSDIARTFLGKIKDGIKDSIPSFEELAKAISTPFGGIGISTTAYSLNGSIPQHANGGFPEDGLFMANHNELVGSFSNGKTAVANNDQIVAGITAGVKAGMNSEEQNALLREQNSLLRQLLDKDTTPIIGDRDIAKANNRGQQSLGYQLVSG